MNFLGGGERGVRGNLVFLIKSFQNIVLGSFLKNDVWNYSSIKFWNWVKYFYQKKHCFEVFVPRRARNGSTMWIFKFYEVLMSRRFLRHFFLHEIAIGYVWLKNIVMFYNRVQNMFLLIKIKLFSFGGKILSWAFWTKYVSTMRFIKIYEKSTSGIFLCFWWSSSIIKTYNNFKRLQQLLWEILCHWWLWRCF